MIDSAKAEVTLEMRLRHLSEAPPDEPRPALVVQGGGLRGVYSMAALAVLEERGLRNAFSVVAGSSAGAINGAYFLAGQAREGLAIYLDELAGSRFVAPYRPWRVVDVDYLVDTVLKRRHPLDLARFHSATGRLLTVLTDAETGAPRIVFSEEDHLDIYEVFRATAALPFLYNKRVRLGTREYVDGGVSSLVPVREALLHSNGEAVVLLTRTAGHRLPARGRLFQAALRLVPGYSDPLRARIFDLCERHNSEMERLEGEGSEKQPTAWTVSPSDPARLVSRTTNSRSRLRDCAEMGRVDMVSLLEEPCGGTESPQADRDGEPLAVTA